MRLHLHLGKNTGFAWLFAAVCCLLFAASVNAAKEDDKTFHRFWPDNLFAVDFVSDDVGFVAGQSGTVLRTTDGGGNWDVLYVGRNELVRRVSFVSDKEGWAVGHRGSIFHTADAGTTWEVQYAVPGVYLRDVDFVNENQGWVVGHDSVILHTSDGGASWQVQEMRGFDGRDLPRFHGVYAKDAMHAIVVGEFGTIVHTEDGGKLWLVTPVDTDTSWMAVDGSESSIYLVGLDGNAGYLSVASEAQRQEIEEAKAGKAAKKEAKARKKAKRKKKAYVPEVVEAIPRSEMEYVFTPIDTGTTEHLFDLACNSEEVVAVGRSTVLRLSQEKSENVPVAAEIPLKFIWFGGVGISPGGKVWAVGIRGLVAASSGGPEGELSPALSLGMSKNITLISNRWVSNNGQ